MDEDKEFARAKSYAFRLLSYRQRSVQELKARLEKKGYSAQIVKKTVDYLSEIDYLNDENFARSWLQTKMESSPKGLSLLRYQLKQKGVAQEIVEKIIGEFAAQFDEYSTAKKLAIQRTKHYQDIEPLKAKRRLYGYLYRRGFSQEVIFKVMDNLAQTG